MIHHVSQLSSLGGSTKQYKVKHILCDSNNYVLIIILSCAYIV